MSADPTTWRPDTLAVRGGLDRSGFMETAEALYHVPPTVAVVRDQPEAIA